MSEWNDKIIEEFRANAGMVGGPFEGTPLILLTTTGARTGAARTNPVACRRDGDRILVFASNAGAPRHPDWYHNLLANPTVTVEVGDGTAIETFIATARPLSGEERDRIYARQAEVAPVFADYQKKASRVIPVVALYRRDPKRARALGDELVRIHDGMRAEMAALLAAIEDAAGNAVEDAAGNAAEDGAATGIPVNLPGRDLEEALRERCLSFCTAFHEHHINESERGFPCWSRPTPGWPRPSTACAKSTCGWPRSGRTCARRSARRAPATRPPSRTGSPACRPSWRPTSPARRSNSSPP